MQLGIGASEFRNSSQIDWKNYFSSARDFGYRYIDTSPFYVAATSERAIGEFLDPRLQFRVTTKFGLPYHDLGSVYGKLSKRINGSRKVDGAWGSHLSPKQLPKELKRSLTRLKARDCYGYLMHSVDATVDLDYWIDALLSLKDTGLVEKIGLSIDSSIEADFSWADILQIPADLINWPGTLNFNGVVMVNGFARSDPTKLNARVSEAKDRFPTGIGIIRSSSLEHLRYFSDLAREGKAL
jgi:aryl-alcohol dehydrogenase-like predicted oxidoreductase